MASRRNLKKTIQYISSELIIDIYLRSIQKNNISDDAINDLVTKVVALQSEFTLRANRPDGKNNSKVVKKYYSNLYAAWQKELDSLLKEIESL